MFTYIRPIPSPEDIKKEIPLPAGLAAVKAARDAEIKAVFTGKSKKFILVIGPCSADSEAPVLDYIGRLGEAQKKLAEKLIIIPRIYTNKPRTTGEGYKGMAHQPDPTEEPNLVEGLKAIRRLHLKAFEQTGLSSADEMLYPANTPYLDDILSYVAVGARSVENQQHRLTASGLDIPCGMKNPTSGDLAVMMNSVQASQMAHVFVHNRCEVKTSGNELAHAILRGAVNTFGQNIPNYHYEDILRTVTLYNERSNLANPAIVVDTNHANSSKRWGDQPRIAHEVLDSMEYNDDIRRMVKGLMIESYIEDGAQKVGEGVYGKSITDPCLGWVKTEKLLFELADRL